MDAKAEGYSSANADADGRGAARLRSSVRTSSASAVLALSDDGAILSRDEQLCTLAGMPTTVLAEGKLAAVVQWLRGSDDELCLSLAEVLVVPAAAGASGEIASADGRVIEWTSTPFAHATLRGRVFVFHDVSNHRADSRALRDAETWLRLFSAHHDGVVVELDGDARVVGLWATEASAFFGVPEPELQGRTISDVLRTPEGAELDRSIRSVLATGRPASFEIALDSSAGAGSNRVFAVNAVLLPTSESAERSVTVLIREITQEARLQVQLRRAERLASIGLLAAGVAHEINNPLGYMLLNLQRVRRGLTEIGTDAPRATDAASFADLEHAIGITIEGALRVQTIVRDLTQFARSGDDEPLVSVDIRRVIDSTLELASAEVTQRARVVRELAPVPPITATEGRLAQVLLNLVLNAAQAIPEGDPEHNEIRVVTRTDERGRATIEVHDTGVGIPAQHVRHIFDPFFTTKLPGLGTGLGLAICHGIITAFGGLISVETREGHGTVFRIIFPNSDPAADSA